MSFGECVSVGLPVGGSSTPVCIYRPLQQRQTVWEPRAAVSTDDALLRVFAVHGPEHTLTILSTCMAVKFMLMCGRCHKGSVHWLAASVRQAKYIALWSQLATAAKHGKAKAHKQTATFRRSWGCNAQPADNSWSTSSASRRQQGTMHNKLCHCLALLHAYHLVPTSQKYCQAL